MLELPVAIRLLIFRYWSFSVKHMFPRKNLTVDCYLQAAPYIFPSQHSTTSTISDFRDTLFHRTMSRALFEETLQHTRPFNSFPEWVVTLRPRSY